MKKIMFSFLLLLFLISCTTKSTVLLDKKQILEVTNTWVTNKVKISGNTWIIDEDIKKVSNQVYWFEEDLEGFNKNYKKAFLNLWLWNKTSIEQIKKISDQWWKIIIKYRWFNVKWVEKTEKLDEKLVIVGIYLLNTTDYNMPDKKDLAKEELEKVGILISKIKQENNINSLSDDMYTFKTNIEKLILDWKIKDSAKIEELRLWIKKLNQYKVKGKEYKKMLSEFEKSLIDFNKLSWKEYVSKLPELKKIFMKMYLLYGQW